MTTQTRAQFGIECGRFGKSHIIRAIREGAMDYDVIVDIDTDQGIWRCYVSGNVSGEKSKVDDFMNAFEGYYDELVKTNR